MNPELLFMQDNALGHSAAYTLQELSNRGISTIAWPPFSPDLNPIEAVWNIMKNWIQFHYGDETKLSYDRLRQAVMDAWNAVSEEQLKQLTTLTINPPDTLVQSRDQNRD